jgi:Protease inhibitor Inh
MSASKFAIFAAFAASLCGVAFAQDMQPKSNPPQNVKNVPPQSPAPQSPAQSPAPQNPQPQNSQDDATSAMIGAWEFSNADHNKICRFTFRADAASSGRRLDIDKNCPSFFPSTKEISAWTVDNYGDLHLLDAQGEAVVDLTQVESGMYDGFTPGEGRYILQTAAAAPMRSADDMVGDWAIARGSGKPICTLTLANSPAGLGAAADALTLKLKPGCDPTVTRFDPSGWRMQEGELMLLSARGQTWQFEENDANTWQRVPESTDPILLMRQ